ncbi:hypothetical protein BDN72DRAFT_836516 [Pluteus cervinus]|uniref:Uncharacterized protein n=1 Tax=Pluteus cervinus TaxID=181527 RepID=A0ACD3B5A7_9AGAR|nr:hypothetical protein BDN72DRAFT_836516 [Pluteus cervinus]
MLLRQQPPPHAIFWRGSFFREKRNLQFRSLLEEGGDVVSGCGETIPPLELPGGGSHYHHQPTLPTAEMATFLTGDMPDDPIDFPPQSQAPGLRDLDAALRCSICGELFDGPVSLSCGHCFCSCCVRTSLSTKQECPTCRKPGNEDHIRPNPSVEEAVLAWKRARQHILHLSKQDTPASADQAESGRPTKRLKRTRKVDYDSDLECIPGPSSSASRSASITPLTPKRHERRKPVSKALIVRTPKKAGSPIPSSDVEESDEGKMTSRETDLVQCPICEKKVIMTNINRHMDNNCQDANDTRSTKSQWAQLMGNNKAKKNQTRREDNDLERLPKASYDALKDRVLKDMLKEHDLSVTGDRNALERRHQRWVMLYNANLDKSHVNRKTIPELRSDLKLWEEERGRRKKHAVQDIETYERQHKYEFQRLIEQARPKQGTKPSSARDDTPEPGSDATIHESSDVERPTMSL